MSSVPGFNEEVMDMDSWACKLCIRSEQIRSNLFPQLASPLWTPSFMNNFFLAEPHSLGMHLKDDIVHPCAVLCSAQNTLASCTFSSDHNCLGTTSGQSSTTVRW